MKLNCSEFAEHFVPEVHYSSQIAVVIASCRAMSEAKVASTQVVLSNRILPCLPIIILLKRQLRHFLFLAAFCWSLFSWPPCPHPLA